MLLSQTSQLSAQVEEGKTVAFAFQYHNRKIIQFLNSLFTKILSRNNIVYLQKTVETVLREMIVNAVKANSKRIYFKVQDLNINDLRDYTRGMEDFKDFIVDKQDLVEAELKKSAYKVELFVKKTNEGIKIFIRNNVPIHPDELHRIKTRIEKAKEYENFADVYNDLTDTIEGEGLGLLLTILFLRNSGIGENSFKVISDGKVTQSSLTIPYELRPIEIRSEIQGQIMEDVKELPTFPENIIELQRMCKDPEISIKQLAERVIMDPAVTASVLKLANSAGFMTMNRTEKMDDAIKIIGLKNLNAILISASARKIMDERYSSFKEIWNHSTRVAYYSRYIAMKTNYVKLAENVFLAGMLHDLGKIVLLSTNSRIADWIGDIAKNRELRTSTVIEEVAIGISHNTIGELIAQKWNMPDYLIEAIRNHHSPLDAKKEFEDIVAIVYLANELCSIEEKRFDFFYFEESVLEKFDLLKEDKFQAFHEELKEQYLQDQERLQEAL